MKHLPLSILLAVSAALPCTAQVRTRWELDFTHSKPALFPYRGPLGRAENYWYVTYRITNSTQVIVPIQMDMALYGNAGKDNLNDVAKVDIETLKAVMADKLTAEQYRYGQYVSEMLVSPDVELSIIEKDLNLASRSRRKDPWDPRESDGFPSLSSPGVVQDSIRAFKAKNEYLNKKEMRDLRVIRPTETYHGIAFFRGVDPRHTMLTLQVSGLHDFVKIDRFDPDKGPIFAYENRMYWARYRYPGDVFERERDPLFFDGKGWEARRIGPASSKEGLELMIAEVVRELREHKRLASAGQPVPEKAAITPRDLATVVAALNDATGQAFVVDDSKSLLENEAKIWEVHEWWLTHKGKLAWDRSRNRFTVVHAELPGTTAVEERP
jgi:hypothetical protein